MFSGKESVINDVRHTLERGGYETIVYENSCFDIIAKKDSGAGSGMLFLKALLNIDSLVQQHARDMKIISGVTGSFCGIVGTRTRYEKMDDGIVYERFGLAAFTPKLLEKMVVYQEFPFLFRDKGGLYAGVDHKKLRKAREEKDLTQEKLAKRIGITKKSVYEHESRDMRMLLPYAKKASRVLDENIMSPFGLESCDASGSGGAPNTSVEREVFLCFRKMGFETRCIKKSPFNVIAKEEEPLFAHAGKKLPEKKIAKELKSLSDIAKSQVLVISEEECRDLPSIKRKKLRKIVSKDELFDILNKF